MGEEMSLVMRAQLGLDEGSFEQIGDFTENQVTAEELLKRFLDTEEYQIALAGQMEFGMYAKGYCTNVGANLANISRSSTVIWINAPHQGVRMSIEHHEKKWTPSVEFRSNVFCLNLHGKTSQFQLMGYHSQTLAYLVRHSEP